MTVVFNSHSVTLNLPQSCVAYHSARVSFLASESVLDDKRGFLVHTNGAWVYITAASYLNFGVKPTKKLALILESPHKDEYSCVGGMLIPKGPALGQTGNRILNNLDKYFNQTKNYTSQGAQFIPLNTGFDYEVLIINALQYQASCFHKLGLRGIVYPLRNSVFKALYNNCNLNGDFLSRLSSASPDYILNGCTYNLKSVIEPQLQAYQHINPTAQRMDCKHPCTW